MDESRKHPMLEGVARDSRFIDFINQLDYKEKASSIYFFERKGGFTVHHDDATLASQRLTKADNILVKGIPTVWLSPSNYQKFIRMALIEDSSRIRIYAEIDGRWSIKRQASPGNVVEVEEILLANESECEPIVLNAGVLAIYLYPEKEGFNIGAVLCDTSALTIEVTRFSDDERLTGLQRLLLQMNPREIIVPDNSLLKASLKRILGQNDARVDFVPESHFDLRPGDADFALICERCASSSESGGRNDDSLRRSIAATVKYCNSSRIDWQRFRMQQMKITAAMRIDQSAIEALHLFLPKISKRGNSVYDVICRARTKGGRLRVANWLRRPLTDKNMIDRRLDIVRFFVEDDFTRNSLYDDKLRSLADLQNTVNKLFRKKAGLRDLYKLYMDIRTIGELMTILDGADSETLKSDYSTKLRGFCGSFDKFSDMVQQVLDIERAEEKQEYIIRSTFDQDLSEKRSELERIEREAKKHSRETALGLGLEVTKELKMDTPPDGGFVYRVSKKEYHRIKDNRAFKVLDVKNNGITFTTTTLSDLTSEYVSVREEYGGIQEKMIGEVIAVAEGYVEPFTETAEVISELDALVGFAVVAVENNFVRPEIRDSGEVLSLKGLRHPVIERLTSSFVPNDIEFCEKSRFFILTGPNMGGKSTFMRSIGAAVVMAQAGCFVPCTEAIIAVRDSVLTRIGAGDEIIKGLSTFMSEMLDMATITKNATPRSLVIIDELGRGTSTYDGLGLAWAIAENIAEKTRSFCVLATHYHELTALEDRIPGVANIHVTAQMGNETLIHLYRVETGPCNRSFGIQVAELAALPTSVISDAVDRALKFNSMECTVMLAKRDDSAKEFEAMMKEFCGECDSIGRDVSDAEKIEAIAAIRKRFQESDGGRLITELVGMQKRGGIM